MPDIRKTTAAEIVVGQWLIGLVTVLLACVTLTGAHAPPAHADGDEPQYEDFYLPPDPLPPGQPGDVVRTEPSRLVLEPSGQLGAILATGTRIMYRSTDARGNPIAVTGTYFEPDNPWPGNGPRPLISYAPGTQGQGNQCAPSRMFNQGIHYSGGWDIMFNYEELFVATMVARGFAIVMTDYEGLGTPPMHTFVNRLAEGQAVLDAARAATRLPGTSLDPNGPVAFWGYSQGGGAVASAAELASSYAPELHIVGTIRHVELEGGFFAIRGEDGVTYDPTNLPAQFQKDGLSIEADVRRRDDRAGIHMTGPIVDLVRIRLR